MVSPRLKYMPLNSTRKHSCNRVDIAKMNCVKKMLVGGKIIDSGLDQFGGKRKVLLLVKYMSNVFPIFP